MKRPTMTSRKPTAKGRSRSAEPGGSAWRWALSGAVIGLLTSLIAFAPASWLASGLSQASAGRVLLSGAQGTVWRGSAQLELGGGSGSTDRTALPGNLTWQLQPAWGGLQVRAHASCCTPAGLSALVSPRWGGIHLAVSDGESNWPAALLTGLGTPWNTLQPEGQLKLNTQGLAIDSVQGRVNVAGGAQVQALQMASRLSTLRPMGSYRLALTGGAVTSLSLDTLEGSLRLSGSGQWAGGRLRFQGEAVAEPDRAAALNNLLNIIGRRDGARSIIIVG
jgi:general secretion pathway protein N